MSFLLAIASMYIAGKVVAEVGRDATKIPARSQIQKDSKNGTFDVVKNFEQILYVCDVKRKKYNSSVPVLPYTGYEKCLKYVREHHMTCRADEQRFINHYRKVLKRELSERQAEWDQHYVKIESQVKAMMAADSFEVVRFTHFNPLLNMVMWKLKLMTSVTIHF